MISFCVDMMFAYLSYTLLKILFTILYALKSIHSVGKNQHSYMDAIHIVDMACISYSRHGLYVFENSRMSRN